jgi:LETM1 and EF-hand domain-containing protein 1, mitochondrial
VSSFLRQTLRETGLPLSLRTTQKEEFTDFFRKVRSTGEAPTQADVIKVCKLFKDDLTLDNLSRPQLVAICRYMNLNTVGPDTLLRYQIRHRMRQIKRDDRAIAFEGVDSLSVPELQAAVAGRGLRTWGVSPGRLRDDLQMWLDLRLKYGVPSTLLVLSNAFMYSSQGATGSSKAKDGEAAQAEGGAPDSSEFTSQIDALQAVLSSIPEELFHEIELEVHTAEGAATNKQRLEVLKEQQELIEEEAAQHGEGAEGAEKKARPAPKDDADIDEKEEQHAATVAEAEAQARGEAKEASAEQASAKKAE